MNKLILLSIGILVAIISGCSSVPSKVAKGYSNPSLDGAPGWVLDPTSTPGIVAIGSAALGLGGVQFQRTEAMAAGRDELARILSLKVKNSLENFARQTGIGDSQTFDKVTKDTSRQLAKETLNGSRQKDLWLAQDGTMFILVMLESKSVAEAAKRAIRSSFTNDNANFQQVESAAALKELDANIDKEFQ